MQERRQNLQQVVSELDLFCACWYCHVLTDLHTAVGSWKLDNTIPSVER